MGVNGIGGFFFRAQDPAALAKWYSTHLGVGAGDIIALFLRNDLAFFEASTAAGLLGAYPTPVNWHGTPEEQGFLHDVQLYACETFTTVLAPGYNAAHYDHIHVDLMRRASGDRPCRPEAMSGEVAAAKARAVYASRRGPALTSANRANARTSRAPAAIPGEDGYLLDDLLINLQSRPGAVRDGDNDITGEIKRPAPVSKRAKSIDDRLTAR